MIDELPQGWAATPLKNLVGPNGMLTDGDWILSEHLKTGKDVRLIQLADVGIGRFLDKSQKFISADTAKSLGVTYLQEGDVLISRMADPLARACLFPKIEKPAITAVDVAIARCDGSTSVPAYLMRVCNSHRVLVQAEEVAVGTTRKRISRRNLELIQVPLAPLPEQGRIVAKLEKLLDRAYACQQRLTKIPVLLKRFRQSVLAAACFGRLTADWREENPNVENASTLVAELERSHEAAGGHKKGNAAPPSDEAHDLSADDLPSSWQLTEMRSVVCPDRPITYGILKPGPDTPGGIPYVRVADFPNDRLNLETIRRTTKEIERTFARARLRAGDILLSIRGTVGRVCVVPRELKDANITQDTARLSVQPALKAGFVKWFLRAAPTQKRMQKAVKGVAVRGINIGDVRALQMPVPPLAEQQEIVRRVEALFTLADQLEARYAKAKAHVEKLAQSILAKAFRGELVPQDPNDEPATELLKRIAGLSPKYNGHEG